MCWNGYAGEVGGVGGALGWEGGIRLQWLQWSLTAFMAGVMPGQKMDASERAIIAVSSRERSLNNLRRGLWSTAIISLGSRSGR